MAVNVKKDTKRNGSVTVKKGGDTGDIIINDLVLRPVDRTKKEIEDLLHAQRMAEFIQNPSRVNLLNLFEVTMMDTTLTGLIGKRFRAVRNKKLRLVKDGKEVEGTDKKIKSKAFRRIRKKIFFKEFQGLAGLEFVPADDITFNTIPVKHIKPHLKRITLEERGNVGYDYTEMPNVWILQSDEEDNNFGLLLKCVAWVTYKRCNVGDLAQFIELFGQPPRVGKYDAGDIQTRKILEEMITKAGTSLGVVIPKTADFEYKDVNAVNGDGKLYRTMHDMCNEELMILVLGQTETTKSSQSSGYAQSKVHAEQQLEITQDDMDNELEALNDPFFMEILKGYGWPVDGAEFVHEDIAKPEALMARLTLDEKLAEKVPQDDDYWYETYQFPKPANYEALKAEKEAKQEQPPVNDKKPPKGKKKGKSNDPEPDDDPGDLADTSALDDLISAGKKVLKSLTSFFGQAPKHSGHSMTNLENLYSTRCNICGGIQLPALADAGADAMDSIIQDIAQQLYNQKLATGSIPADLYQKTADRLMSGVLEGLGGSAFGFDDTRNQLKAYLEHNIYAFSAAKSLTELKEFRSLMTDKEGKVRSSVEFRNACVDAGKQFNINYLETERVTAIATAQTAAAWDGFADDDYIEISTAGDDRVRPSHQILDGFTALKSDPVWRRLCPPFDWMCRCMLVPGVKANAKKVDKGQLIKDADIPKYFQRNPGITRLVFDEDHPYYINSYGKETEMSAEAVYGMPSVPRLYAVNDYPLPLEFDSKDAANMWWKEKAGSAKGSFDAKDYGGMTVRFDNTFRKHVFEANQESRFLHVANTQDIIRSPDEVWSQKEKGVVKRFYLKYYDDYPYVVRVDGDTAYTMHNFEKDGKLNEASIRRLRRGVLIYRKN